MQRLEKRHMRILQIYEPKEIRQIMQGIRVDDYGIRIMMPKAITHLIRIDSVSNITANILKQEMLSLGGDVAVARGALTGTAKHTDCLLIGNLSQFNRLNSKLHRQPFGLEGLARQLSDTLNNYHTDDFTLKAGRYKINLGRRAHIMGIINVTPDSFSGDGLYGRSVSEIVETAQRMIKDGADIIDIGGESSRPHAAPVSPKEELRRVIPVIRALAKRCKIPVSVDTSKAQVAEAALENGAAIVNDITGLRNAAMLKLISRHKAGVVIMHMQGNPRTMQAHPEYKSLIDDIIQYLGAGLEKALDSGIGKDGIIIDPGLGFGKTPEHNLEILKRLGEFKVLGRPIMVGPSRKSFIGRILKAAAQERIFGTVSACVLAVKNGAKLVRVHDVKAVKEALKVLESIDKS